ncbi:kinase-like domain-containing protein [Cantharellus anzutake]|uniref:kinase-like domain-containing protein n=1 Tax=Cantharellus anzutake TaxID=1750568 RepID=UPI0019047D2F|nr:kinase-like domain-containing protein [Cantharellus anzutake]KAF8339151.1 kinase-like domain-containing protein [Cantharellus anzutake]
MPIASAAMDAFKNLIRHGKHARTAPDPSSSKPPQHQQQQQPQPQQQQQYREHARQIEQEAQHRAEELALQQSAQQRQYRDNQFYQPPAAILSPPASTKEAAEYIVQEERQAKNRMPQYPGLEQFRLIDKMGDGAFSNVYKAIDLRTGQKVAVKVVHKFELNSSQAGNKHLNEKFKKKPRATERANILKEVQIMRGLHHSSIVKLLLFSESEEFFFLILELMEGGELFHQIVKLTYFSENLARHVILQVAQGIRYLHKERGVVHRDIKPENLLFERIPLIPSKYPVHRQFDEGKADEGEFILGVGGGEIGRVKIADFGLSKVVWSEETATPCGTVGYTAPEIVKDERYSKSVDMWALGCVLYTLLCGFPPFYDESINALTEKVAKGQYTFLEPWWNDISVSAKDLITHLLSVNPAERYTIDEFLAHPWCHAVAAPPPPPTPAQELLAMDSPLLRDVRGRPEVRSPGLATLKEAFDVTYAVHRMEEEGARRRAYAGPRGAGARGFLLGLNEDDEEEEEAQERDVIDSARRRHQQETVTNINAPASIIQFDGRAGARDVGTATGRSQGVSGGRGRRTGQVNGGFELDIGGATLLGRRHRRDEVEPSLLGQATLLAGGEPAYGNFPGSPMRGLDGTR